MADLEQQLLGQDPEVLGLQRQRQLADLLTSQAFNQPQGQMISGRYVAPSALQQALPMIQAAIGGLTNANLDTKQQELAAALRGKQQQIFQGVVGNVAVAVVTYIVANAANDKTEMKHLALALQAALAQNGARDQSTVDKLLATVEKMSDALRPAARQAVAPIGKSCQTVRIGGESGVTIDADDKARMMLEPDTEITTERQWKAVITELDREKFTGKARLDGDKESRIPIVITDPVFQVAANAYITAFVTGAEITLIGKAEISEGNIKRLHISNTA